MVLTYLRTLSSNKNFEAIAAEVEKQTGVTPAQLFILLLQNLPVIEQAVALLAAKDYPGLLTLLLSLVNAPKAV